MKYLFQCYSKLMHGAFRVALNDERFYSGKRSDFFFDVFERTVSAKIGRSKGFPKLYCGFFVHVEVLMDILFSIKDAAEIHHPDIKVGMAIAEVA